MREKEKVPYAFLTPKPPGTAHGPAVRLGRESVYQNNVSFSLLIKTGWAGDAPQQKGDSEVTHTNSPR